MSVQCKKPPFTRAMFIDGSKFHGQFLKRVTQGTFLLNYFKVPIAHNYKGVCLQNTSKPHLYHLKCGDFYDFMDR